MSLYYEYEYDCLMFGVNANRREVLRLAERAILISIADSFHSMGKEQSQLLTLLLLRWIKGINNRDKLKWRGGDRVGIYLLRDQAHALAPPPFLGHHRLREILIFLIIIA